MPTNDERNPMENNVIKPKDDDKAERNKSERNEEQDAVNALKQHIDEKDCL